MVWSSPWPGGVQLYVGADVESAEARLRLTQPARTGVLLEPLPAGPEGRWRRDAALRMRLNEGALESRSRLAVLAGANRLAVEAAEGWEVIGYETAQLMTDGSYSLTGLLRGLGGSESGRVEAGARLVILDQALGVLPVSEAERGAALSVTAVPEGARRSDARARHLTAIYEGRDLRPLSPVHVRIAETTETTETLTLSWIRRTRIGGDRWQGFDVPLGEAQEAYQISLHDADEDLIGTWVCAAPRLDVPRADLPSDLAGHVFSVSQLSERYGAGLASVLHM